MKHTALLVEKKVGECLSREERVALVDWQREELPMNMQAELLTLRRDTVQIIDAENNRFKEKNGRNRSREKNRRSRNQKAEKRKSRKNSPLLMNQKTHLRNEVELSPQRFLAESSTKGVSAQDLRSKFQPIYHIRHGFRTKICSELFLHES
ncbi:MAG: hypothetical protein M3Z08_13800 [Chloroflexota bacterium]|nr:hypothetical protein [Chloroflexota bacterium]